MGNLLVAAVFDMGFITTPLCADQGWLLIAWPSALVNLVAFDSDFGDKSKITLIQPSGVLCRLCALSKNT